MAHLTKLDNGKFNYEVTVDNEMVAKDFNDFLPQVLAHLRNKLKNQHANLIIRISEAEEQERAYSRIEKFQMMAQKNPAVIDLQKAFGLELY